jgi:hypothetical protein
MSHYRDDGRAIGFLQCYDPGQLREKTGQGGWPPGSLQNPSASACPGYFLHTPLSSDQVIDPSERVRFLGEPDS